MIWFDSDNLRRDFVGVLHSHCVDGVWCTLISYIVSHQSGCVQDILMKEVMLWVSAIMYYYDDSFHCM